MTSDLFRALVAQSNGYELTAKQVDDLGDVCEEAGLVAVEKETLALQVLAEAEGVAMAKRQARVLQQLTAQQPSKVENQADLGTRLDGARALDPHIVHRLTGCDVQRVHQVTRYQHTCFTHTHIDTYTGDKVNAGNMLSAHQLHTQETRSMQVARYQHTCTPTHTHTHSILLVYQLSLSPNLNLKQLSS